MGLRKNALKEHLELKLIENPSPETLEQLYQIDINAHQSPWTYDAIRDCFTDNTRCIGLYLKGELIGFSVICIIFDEVELYTIGIIKKYQGLGFGHKLLLHTLHVAKDSGGKQCFLEVRVTNNVALYLYDLYGFTITGTRKNYYPATSTSPAENAYTMVCDLSTIPEETIEGQAKTNGASEATSHTDQPLVAD